MSYDNIYLQYALNYLEKYNLSIIPFKSVNKSGCPFKWRKYQNQLPTSEEIIEWWNKYPEMGIAILTGKINDLVVVDVDPRNGGDETINQFDIPDTWTVHTGGDGWHYYFRYPDIKQQHKIKGFKGKDVGLPGIDFKGDGGLVIAPPSLHKTGNTYNFVKGFALKDLEPAAPPDWLMEIITTDNQNSNTKISLPKKSWPEKWSGVGEGARNTTAASLAGKLAYSKTPFDIALEALKEWNEQNYDQDGNPAPLPDDELRKTLESIYTTHKRGLQEGLETFTPVDLSELLTERLQRENETIWVYVPEMELFYYYSQHEGYWRTKNEDYLRAEIRKLIRDINPEWENKRNIEEVLDAFKHDTQHEKYSKIFRGEKKPDLLHINLKNGVLEWKKGALKKHKWDFFSLNQLPVEYRPEAKCPRWQQSLDEWIPSTNTIKFLQEYIGYCLIPDTSLQLAVFLLGSGANGKSTFLDVIMELFGERNLSSIPLSRLAERFETANLQSKLVNICSDIDPVYLKQTGLLKMIIAGDRLRGEHKYKDSFEFRPVARLLFSSNELPTSKDKTRGWYRRLKIVEFPNTFTRGSSNWIPNLKEKLFKELPGIFNWSLEGLRRLRKQGHFTSSSDIEEAKRNYEAENDSVTSFARDRLSHTDTDEPKYTIPKSFLYRCYKSYCVNNGYKAVGRRKMVSRLKKMNYQDRRRRKHSLNTGSKKPDSFLNQFYDDDVKTEDKSVRCFIRMLYEEEN